MITKTIIKIINAVAEPIDSYLINNKYNYQEYGPKNITSLLGVGISLVGLMILSVFILLPFVMLGAFMGWVSNVL